MLQKYKSYVNANKDILVDCIDLPEEKFARKCNGTINIALARFNTILLHLIKYPLLAEQYSAQVEELQKTLAEVGKVLGRDGRRFNPHHQKKGNA